MSRPLNALSMFVPYGEKKSVRRMGELTNTIIESHRPFDLPEVYDERLYSAGGLFYEMLTEDNVPKVISIIRDGENKIISYVLLIQGSETTGLIGHQDERFTVLGLIGAYTRVSHRAEGYARMALQGMMRYLKNKIPPNEDCTYVIYSQTRIIAPVGRQLQQAKIAHVEAMSFSWVTNLHVVKAA